MSTTMHGPRTLAEAFPPGIGSDLTRRELLAGAGGLLLLGAAGCGGGGDRATTGGTRTIEHKYGSTEISGSLERVVSVGYTDQDPILALGVRPVGVRGWLGDQPPVPAGELYPQAGRDRREGLNAREERTTRFF